MGNSAGWKDVFSLGAYSAQRKQARAQAAAAERYAQAQEEQARAIASSSAAQPGTVQAATASTQEAAESNVQSRQKRRKTEASTVHQRFRGLGSGGGKQNLGEG